MPIDRLKQTLEELRQQLESADSLDDDARAQLRAAMGEIQDTLAKANAGGPSNATPPTHEEGAGPIDQLGDFVKHFEEEHPVLSQRLSGLVSSLNRLGF